MPYGNGSKPAPDNVPPEKRDQWIAVWNEVFARTKDEEQAFRAAYAAIKKSEADMEDAEKAGRRHSKGDMDMFDHMIAALDEMKAKLQELRGVEEEDYEKRDIPSGEREEYESSDFIDPTNRRFPVKVPADVSAAVSSFGRMGEPKIPFDSFKRRLISICRRKGESFMSALPEEWKKDMEKSEDAEWTADITKIDLDRQLAYGVVLKPAPFFDHQDDRMTEDEIEKAAHNWMMKSRLMDLQHEETLKSETATPVESFIAPQDMIWTIGEKKRIVPKGSWVLVTYVKDKKIWDDVKAGKINAYSIKGYGIRRKITPE